jgi:hypothetical protein
VSDLVQRPSGFASIDLISGDNFERVERVATGLAQSGVFKDVTSTQNAMAKILLGADLGLTPTQALMNLDVVEGNARVRSVLLGAWVRQHLWARAMSNGVRWYCPDLTGGVAVYTEADEFVESTAVEIASGEGDGSEPGWDGLSEEQVAEVEAFLAVSETFGHPLEKGSVQVLLNGRPEAVEGWLADQRDVLAMHKKAEEKGGDS